MQNNDNDCIRYLMREMEPSEELRMEREMMEDENLLIEVESMRQTLQKLDKLPEKEPPADVQQNIMEQASAQAARNKSTWMSSAYKYAAAAVILLTVGGGGAWYFTSQSQSSSAGLVPSPQQVSRHAPALRFSGTSTADMARQTTEPWVDHNQVLNFKDRSDGNQDFEAIQESSLQKLKEVHDSDVVNQRLNPIHLTSAPVRN